MCLCDHQSHFETYICSVFHSENMDNYGVYFLITEFPLNIHEAPKPFLFDIILEIFCLINHI